MDENHGASVCCYVKAASAMGAGGGGPHRRGGSAPALVGHKIQGFAIFVLFVIIRLSIEIYGYHHILILQELLMLLKNLMEDKKLNLNQPLLSVRRQTPVMNSQNFSKRKAEIIPHYRSELKSGPVTNPGAVPFHWEQTPGQPKQDVKNSDKLPPTFPNVSPKYSKTRPILDEKDGESENGDEAFVDAQDLLSSLAKRYSYFPTNEEDESDGDDECEKRVNLPSVCCLLPRSCLQSSVCIISPVPEMTLRTRVGTSPVNRIRARSSSASSLTEIENELKSSICEPKDDRAGFSNDNGKLEIHDITDVTKCDGIKGIKTFQELLAEQEEFDSSASSLVEKTVYVDTVHKVGMHVVDSSLHGFNKSCTDKSNKKRELEMGRKEAVKNTEKHTEFPVPPPLPKSPSDSWLRRTLPSITSKNMYIRSYTRSRGTIVSSKWETMVKSTKVQLPNCHWSEEELVTIPET